MCYTIYNMQPIQKEEMNFLRDYGYIAPVRKEQDYIFGASRLPITPINISGDWIKNAPKYEPQILPSGEDENGCTIWGTQNGIETYLNYITKKDFNFSERLNYISAHVRPPGANPFEIGENIRHIGLVDQDVLPMTNTFNEFIQPDPIPETILQRAKLFLDKFEFNHEHIFTDYTTTEGKRVLLERALKCSPVGISLCAWFQDDDGLYYRPEGMPDSHWCLLLKIGDDYDVVLDSYDQGIKYIRKDMNYGMAIRYYLKEKLPVVEVPKTSWFNRFISFIKREVSIFNFLRNQ